MGEQDSRDFYTKEIMKLLQSIKNEQILRTIYIFTQDIKMEEF